MVKPIGAICNLDCTYCYYLHKKDLLGSSSKFQISDEILGTHIRQYIEGQDGPEVVFSWQGGEPTLLGLEFFAKVIGLEKKYKRPNQRCFAQRTHFPNSRRQTKGGSMRKDGILTNALLLVIAALLALVLAQRGTQVASAALPTLSVAQPQQFPMMDKAADKLIQKYQGATCEQLWLDKSKKQPKTTEEQEFIAILKGDPQMRAAFLNKVAPPIANKMFDCGMIP